MLPPLLIRRVVLAPLVIVIGVAFVVLFPLLALVALTFGAVGRSRPGRMRVLRLLYFALIWLTAETAALFMCLGLWVASGFGGRLRTEPYRDRHYRVMKWFLGRLYRSATKTFRVQVIVDEPELTPAERAARLARGLDQAGALVIFPEGGNWTPGRWQRGIRRLEQLGRRDLADRARNMPNLLPPRAGGALAAITACPAADVIFVAHAGLDRLVSVADVWRSLPMDQVVHAKWWRVPVGDVPRHADHESQVQWLYDWWQRIDTWITQNRPPGAQAPALSIGPAASPGPAAE